jgi:uncharacterized protein YecT (DUF1311 family)
MKRSGHITLLIFCLVFPGRLFAQCDSKGTTADVTECYAREYKKADAELNRVYTRALKDLDSADAAQLRKAQRAWISYRDGQCNAEYALWGGGTGGSAGHLHCLLKLTQQRIGYLEEFYEHSRFARDFGELWLNRRTTYGFESYSVSPA